MPTMIIGAALAGAAQGVIAGTFAFSWAAFGASLLLGAVSQAMQKKPSSAGSTISTGPSGRLVTVRQSIAPWQIIYGQAKVGGCITFFEASADNQYVHLVITLAGHECEEIGDIYFNDEVVPLDGSGNATGKYAGYVRVHKHLGDPADALQPFASLEAESDGKWTSAHLQRGRAKIYVRLTANPDLFPTGIPNIAAVVKGVNNITDPRDASTGWSDNPVLCLEHYLYDTTFGCGATFPDEFETTTIAAEASICDELVNLAGSPTTTEKRYRLNGAFQTSEKPKAVIEIMLSAMAGKAINVGGLWYIYAGAYSSPTVTLTADDLAGPISVQSHVSRRESANGCKGVFTDPNNAWQATDFPAIASDTYMAEDGGDRVWKDIDLSGFVTSGTQAQRLAKIELLKIRQGLSVTATFKLSAYACVTGRTVAMPFAEFGWVAKAFEVVNTRFTYGDDGKLSVELSLRETAAAVYDWSTSEEQTVDISPNTTLPDVSAVGTPSVPSVIEVLYETTGSAGLKSKAQVSWSAPNDAFLLNYQLEYKLSSSSTWLVRPLNTSTADEIPDLTPEETYDFRVKGYNYLGYAGDYSPTCVKELRGLLEAPEDVGNFSVQSYAGMAKFLWDATTSIDVKQGGKVFVRWSPLTTGADWNKGSLVNPDGFPGADTSGLGPLYTGTYMAKFRDSTGHYSNTESSFVVTEAIISGLTTLTSVTYHTAFSGSYSNVALIDSTLQLAAQTNWDSMSGNVDTWGLVDYLGGIHSSGYAVFTDTMDLGSVKSVRLVTTLKSEAFDTGEVFDFRTNNVDDWGSWDGTIIDDAEADILVSTTDDNPSGSPTWGPWHKLNLVADYRCRAFRFQASFTSANVTHNRRITELSIAAKQ